jgi:DNA-binding NarL/FixJ family response regulator
MACAAREPLRRALATLAAAGHSNREIAQQLYVTWRMVETHLTHVFQKLGVTTRSELAARLEHTSGISPVFAA